MLYGPYIKSLRSWDDIDRFHPVQLPPFIAVKDPQTQKSGGILT